MMITNLAPNGVLNFEDIVRIFLAEEIKKKSMNHGKYDAILDLDRATKQFREKS